MMTLGYIYIALLDLLLAPVKWLERRAGCPERSLCIACDGSGFSEPPYRRGLTLCTACLGTGFRDSDPHEEPYGDVMKPPSSWRGRGR